jgi:acetate kinase
MNARILSVNGGSSSIKFSIFKNKEQLISEYTGNIQRIGFPDTELRTRNSQTGQEYNEVLQINNLTEAVNHLTDWFSRNQINNITAIGHRIVFGMNNSIAECITEGFLTRLEQNFSIDPDHVPGEILLIKAFKEKYPNISQVACSDTAFHADLPRRAALLPLPRRYFDSGLRRYGFHGISYSYLMQKLKEEKNIHVNGKIILAHLGSGASITAVDNEKSIDTSMSFSPTGGFPMSTRSGDIDPGIVSFLMKNEKLTTDEFSDMINHQSGLLGISETSSDMKDLLKVEKSDPRALEAIEIFCYQVKKWIGSFVAALGGLDLLVFSGGIGENAPQIRSSICKGLQFLGIDLNENRNDKSEKIISDGKSKVLVCVMPTDEELMIAKLVCQVLST